MKVIPTCHFGQNALTGQNAFLYKRIFQSVRSLYSCLLLTVDSNLLILLEIGPPE